jgi:hypothetical protein
MKRLKMAGAARAHKDVTQVHGVLEDILEANAGTKSDV